MAFKKFEPVFSRRHIYAIDANDRKLVLNSMLWAQKTFDSTEKLSSVEDLTSTEKVDINEFYSGTEEIKKSNNADDLIKDLNS